MTPTAQLEARVAELEARLHDVLGTDAVDAIALKLRLTPKQARMLAVLVRRAPAVVSREGLYAALWGDAARVEIVKVTLCHLRARLVDIRAPHGLVTQPGVGAYCTRELAQWVQARIA